MTHQATWISVPRRRSTKVKMSDAMARVDRLADWYTAYKPEVHRMAVSTGDYKAFEAAAGSGPVSMIDGVIQYRDFVIVRAP